MYQRTVRLLAFVLVASLGVVACGDVPTEPHDDGTVPSATVPVPVEAEALTVASPDPTGLARFQNGPPGLGVAGVKQTIGPEGGSLRLYDYEVVVPEGAVAEPTRFTIRLPANPSDREHVMADFGPHGATFAVPVLVRFPVTGTTLEGAETRAVVWWNGSEWEPQPSSDLEGGARIEAPTDHFSTYGAADSALFAEMSSGG